MKDSLQYEPLINKTESDREDAKIDGYEEGSRPKRSSATISNEGGSTSGDKAKRGDIQCLRGVAIIYVLLFHLFPNYFPKGFLGVDVFFVISGYLITMILSKKTPISLHDTGRFFSKRIRRIFPAYYVMIFAVIAIGWILLTSNDQDLLHIDSMWALAFASNIHKYLQMKDYFAQIANYDFLLHAWSLAVEIQFYCIAPLLAAVGHRLRIGGLLLALIGILSIAFNISSRGDLQFSSLASRLWQFMAGGLAYNFNRKWNVLPGMVSRIFTLLALVFISPVILFPYGHDMEWRFVVTIASAVIIARLSPIDNDFVLGGRVLLFVGDISYSVYLAHWPIIVFLKYHISASSLPLSLCIIAAQLSFLIAYVSFEKIEKYFIRESLIKALIFISLLLCFSVTFIVSPIRSYGIINQRGDLSVNQSIEANATVDNTTAEVDNRTRFERNCKEFRHMDYRPINLTKELIQSGIKVNRDRFMHYWPSDYPPGSLPDPLYKKHFVDKNFTIPFNAYFKGKGKAKIVVMGNSFAHRALFAIIRGYGDRLGEIRLLSHIGCPPFIGTTYPGQPCVEFQQKSYDLIEEMKPDVTFMIFRPFDPIDSPFTTNLTDDGQFKLIQSSIDRLSPVSKRIVLEYPLPTHKSRQHTPFLLMHLQRPNPSLEEVKLDYSFYWENSRHLYKRLDSVKCTNCDRIYPHKLFCDTKVCRLFDPDNLYSFFDMGQHYNDYAMLCIWEYYAEVADDNYANGVIEH